VASHLTVTSVGARSRSLARQLEMLDDAVIPIDKNGLFRCVGGQLVYEPDTSQVEFPFPQRLHRGRLGCFVAAPLLVESQVFGILLAARHPTDAFSSTDCEFLRQLTEHVALAAHQAQIHSALQQAYDDLRLTQQTVMQQERLRALGQMASGIAHDINNALSPVALYTEMLLEREPNLSPRTREYLGTAQRAIGDVTQTVARMREFHRKQEPQLLLSPVDLNLMVQQTIDLTRVRWSDMPQRRGVVVELALDLASELPAIAGVESEIRDALTNLVFNAVDSMAQGGVLTIRTRNQATASDLRTVSVEVSDTGIGMDEETRRRCLEPFFTTKGERGSGLGLAMVYGVTQRHKGEIELESARGQGTTVRLNLPAHRDTAGSEALMGDADILTRRLRLLVVDDDPLLIKSLRDSLEADGHIVTVAHGGQEGIDKFTHASKGREPFAVVITDLGMPHVDGSKVASAVKAASPVTPVILLTGWGQRLSAEGTVPASVDRVLNKPPRLRELRSALGELTAEALPGAVALK
jgi:signal transduction histidine kinase/ActR/RegA family two-component response regulator